MNYEPMRIETPEGILLDGLWFGPQNPKRTFIFIHGLGADVFSGQDLLIPLLDSESAALFFNNRGHDGITRIDKIDKRKRKGRTSIPGGMSHEVFTECIDDIQGAINTALLHGTKEIILVGHSTGSQKAVYYLGSKGKRKTENSVTKVILLSPLSDYAGITKEVEKRTLANAQTEAERLVAEGKPHELLPSHFWSYPLDAQRFLSLYTPDSPEEIFSYAQPKKKPLTLQRVKSKIVVILGEKDEYRDRPVKFIAKWFEKMLQKQNARIFTIPNAGHSFTEYEDKVVTLIRKSI